MKEQSMNHWKLVLGVALIFLFGALAGSIGTGYYIKKYSSRSAGFRYEKVSILEKVSKELNLSADQKNQIGKILDRLEEKRREHISGIASETRLAVTQIIKELKPDQRRKFDLMREEYKKRKRSGE
jgi:hypothetical protein